MARNKTPIELENREAIAEAIQKATGRHPRFQLYDRVSKHQYAAIGFVVAMVREGIPLHYAIGVSAQRYQLDKRLLRSLADQAFETDNDSVGEALVEMLQGLHDWNLQRLQGLVRYAAYHDSRAVEYEVYDLVAELRDIVNGILAHVGAQEQEYERHVG